MPKKQNMTIGKKIKLARSLMGLTTTELGELIGLSNDRIRQYEADVRTPRRDKIKDFCDVLGVSESFFCKSSYGNKGRYYPVII